MDRNKLQVGCVLMAAGWSSRFGEDKLLLKFEGENLVCRAMSQLKRLADREPLVSPAVIARRQEVALLACQYQLPCRVYEGGVQSDTIRAALDTREADRWAGCMFIPGDQPYLTAESMAMLLHAFLEAPDRIHRLGAGGRSGNPVVFPASCFAELRALKGDVGGRALIRQGILPVMVHDVGDPRELCDVDTPEDLERVSRAGK